MSSRGTMLHSCIKVRQPLKFTEAPGEIGCPVRIFVVSFCRSRHFPIFEKYEDMGICNCGDNGDIAQDGDIDNNDITRVMMQPMISSMP